MKSVKPEQHIPDIPVGIGFSGGVSSEWQIRAMIEGVIARPEHVAVFFANTRDEHTWTYERVAMVEEACRAAGIPFFRCSDETGLSNHIIDAVENRLTHVDNPPFWTENPGGVRGQLIQKCTAKFKTAPIRRAESAWLKSIGMPKQIVHYVGFGADEQHRANKAIARNDVIWQKLDFPAIRLGRSRAAQRADVERWTGSSPLFSACVECPYKDPRRWMATTGADLAKAIDIDERIRHGLESAAIEETCYLTDRLIPLERLIRKGDPQPSLPGFDPPGCDSGACFL